MPFGFLCLTEFSMIKMRSCWLRSTIYIRVYSSYCTGMSQVALVVENLPASAGALGDAGSAPGSGRSPGGGHSNPLKYSCLENPMDRGAWRATVRSITKIQTRLKRQPALCIVHSLDLDKWTMRSIHHSCIIQNSFITIKLLCALPIHPSLPPPKPW